jgi:hypothetical protein
MGKFSALFSHTEARQMSISEKLKIKQKTPLIFSPQANYTD